MATRSLMLGLYTGGDTEMLWMNTDVSVVKRRQCRNYPNPTREHRAIRGSKRQLFNYPLLAQATRKALKEERPIFL